MISDYTIIPDEEFEVVEQPRAIVSYNAAKAPPAMAAIRADMTELEFLPLGGMSPLELFRALKSSTVYLDLGPHPGKDRMPREAALAGAVIVAARRGAASYFSDMPLDRRYKVSEAPNVVPRVRSLLGSISHDPEAHYRAQAEYRQRILQEKQCFFAEVHTAFIDGEFGWDRVGVSFDQ